MAKSISCSRSRSQEHKNKHKKNREHKHRHKKHKHEKKSTSNKIKMNGSEGNDQKETWSMKTKDKEKIQQKDEFDAVEHYDINVGDKFKNGQYEMTGFICDGTFGRVVEVRSIKDNKLYAMKIIRAVERFVHSAKAEEYILKYLEARNHSKSSKIVRLHDSFDMNPNYCIIFERLGLSLYEIQKKNDYQGFPIKLVQSFFRQLLQAVGFMHSLQITHTDLKTENILVCSTELVEVKVPLAINDRKNDQSDHKKLYLPLSDDIKLIDMGGATFDYEHHFPIINTMQYRSPEVILGCTKWDSSSDIWGVACIVIELLTGELFFSTLNCHEHLAMIEKVCGPIPDWMVNRTGPPLDKNFTLNYKTIKLYKSNYIWPYLTATAENLKKIRRIRQIDEIVCYPSLVDLLKRMLKIDPQQRISCAQALTHIFFRENYDG